MLYVHRHVQWSWSSVPKPPVRITLYTKRDCPLCDEADRIIRGCIAQRHVVYEQVDITQDPSLQKSYGQTIPVVAIDGNPLFFGKVSAFRLEKILSGQGVSERYKAFLRRFTSRFYTLIP